LASTAVRIAKRRFVYDLGIFNKSCFAQPSAPRAACGRNRFTERIQSSTVSGQWQLGHEVRDKSIHPRPDLIIQNICAIPSRSPKIKELLVNLFNRGCMVMKIQVVTNIEIRQGIKHKEFLY